MSQVIIALGANLGNREETFRKAIEHIGSRVGDVVRCSSWIETEPLMTPEAIGSGETQPLYLNGVILVETGLEPLMLLAELQKIEYELGRDRGVAAKRWEARTIDLDIIAIEDRVIDLPQLKVPHPEMHKRHFVLEPMLEMFPSWLHPVLVKSPKELLEESLLA